MSDLVHPSDIVSYGEIVHYAWSESDCVKYIRYTDELWFVPHSGIVATNRQFSSARGWHRGDTCTNAT